MFRDLNEELGDAITIYCDNKSAIDIAENPIWHGKTKHIVVKYHALKEIEKEGKVKLVHCNSNKQLINILTKLLSKSIFKH